ncbi:hypothetical protein [Pararhodobacter oceanensis]|uniref:hypothetical protein n=1 Tax=Pararhodobacter oceanensis TaxID=2172121 RepID=UPI003A92C5F4
MTHAIPKLLTAVFCTVISAQAAAADATSTIRDLMGARPAPMIGHSTRLHQITPGLPRDSRAQVMLRAMLSDMTTAPRRLAPRHMLPRARLAPPLYAPREIGFHAPCNAKTVSAFATPQRFGAMRMISALRDCGAVAGAMTLHLGTAMRMTPNAAGPNTVIIYDNYGTQMLDLRLRRY